MKYQQIYADVLSHCVKSPPPKPWSRLAGGGDFWRTPLSATKMLGALQKKHDVHKLIQSGIAVETDHQLHLHQVLLNVPGTVLPLRRTPDGHPFDFVTEQGTIRGVLPIRSAVLDHLTSSGIAECGYLFLAAGVQDTIRLRSLGMPVAPAFGLDRFSDRSLQHFQFALGLRQKKPPVAPHQLILVDWSPTLFSGRRTEFVDQVTRNLIDNRFCLGIPLHDILVWRPAVAEIQVIADCLQIGQLPDVVSAIHASLERSCIPLSDDPTGSSPRRGLVECERRLRDALVRRETSMSRRHRRLRDFDRALEQELIQPLVQQAENEKSLADQNRWRAVAELNRSLYRATTLERAKLDKQIIENGLSGEVSSVELSKLLRGFDTVHKLLKEDD